MDKQYEFRISFKGATIWNTSVLALNLDEAVHVFYSYMKDATEYATTTVLSEVLHKIEKDDWTYLKVSEDHTYIDITL